MHWMKSAAGVVMVVGGLAACSSSSSTGDGGLACGVGSTACSGVCTVLARDPANCGACGTACTAGEVCSAGTCAVSCGAGTTTCGSSCVDEMSDPANCGACAKKCDSGDVCSKGVCALTCATSETTCGQSCVDTQSDRTHCGDCNTTCAAGQICTAGSCTLSCQTGLTKCAAIVSDAGVSDASTDASIDASVDGGDASSDAATLSGDYCANLLSDNQNCGGCGVVCSSTSKCTNGSCAVVTCTATLLSNDTSWTQNNLTYASEILNNTYNPTNLLDNDITTRWVALDTTNQWVIFNFGATKTLGGFRILNQANYTPNSGAKDTVLQVGSSTSGPWTDVVSFTVANQQSSFQDFYFPATASQYWRVFVKDNWGYQNYIQYMEVGFYGCE